MTPRRLFQGPRGTRDFYPPEMLRRRYIERAWRHAAIRHGFDEIEGPIFEHLETYLVKSGEGIVSELFSFRREGGEQEYALRPEFTPTLARMYAARAASLPRPVRWFMAGPFFRAERPQRGRLREFLQWNADVVGDATPAADAQVIGLCVTLLEDLGLTPTQLRVRLNHRQMTARMLERAGVRQEHLFTALTLLDRRDRTGEEEFARRAAAIGLDVGAYDRLADGVRSALARPTPVEVVAALSADLGLSERDIEQFMPVFELLNELDRQGARTWCEFDPRIVRGLAYYTGLVFEVHEVSGTMRAIAGGGRYDQLIELFGGPSTPAVGFGMGDVVLEHVLQEHGLMPSGRELLERVSMPVASLRPDAFVLSNGSAAADATIAGLVAGLRRRGLHIRCADRSSRQIGKLLGHAADLHARHAVIIESASEATVKDLDRGTQQRLELARLGDWLAARSGLRTDRG